MRWQGDRQEAPDRELVDRELQDPGHGLEPAERVHQAAILAGAVQRHPHAEPAVPALKRVDGVLEH
jgi:hypothetical protein